LLADAFEEPAEDIANAVAQTWDVLVDVGLLMEHPPPVTS
jgi:hypothetical protein